MASKILLILFLLVLPFNSNAQTRIKAGYWFYGNEFPISDINSSLFTHLLCAFAQLNSSTYQLSIPSNEQDFSAFTDTVKQKNPSIITLLSIGGGDANETLFSSMVSQSSLRKSFIESSIRIARLYGFYGLDLSWGSSGTSTDMTNIASLLDEWRAAVTSEPRNSNESQLILTMAVYYSPTLDTSVSYPVDSMRRNLDWLNVNAYDYYTSSSSNFTRARAALYDPDPLSRLYSDYGIREWIGKGMPTSKLVLGMPYHGYKWTLANPSENASIGAPAIDFNESGIGYKDIKKDIQQHGVASVYNGTYVVNYCTFESFWIGFDDVEAITAKVSYAKKQGLLGYYVWQVPNDDNWVLSLAAQNALQTHQNRARSLLIILLTTAMAILLLAPAMIYLRRRVIKSKGVMDSKKESRSKLESNGENSSDGLQVFSFASIEAATNNFSIENKLGKGGFGPVYKGELWNGQAIAVKRLSKTSRQGLEEFKNEVTLTARLQHVNLVRVLGFCTDREEKLLIYEYMPNRSLDFFLFDPARQFLLDWNKRIRIIEGVTQGFLYLQEYSRLTVLHRDLKASNILLDKEMKPKISDFGMAKIFEKDEHETNKEQTKRIVGTYGYVPPECVKEGIYSMKSDVYSFGVLLLQIISGKKSNCLYGVAGSLNLQEYAYVLWRDGKGMEFMDPSLDDTSSSCKLMSCMQVALLCVQEKPDDRPSMLEVSSMLKNETTAIATPKKPAFSTRIYEDEENGYKLQHEICSINDATISQMEPR